MYIENSFLLPPLFLPPHKKPFCCDGFSFSKCLINSHHILSILKICHRYLSSESPSILKNLWVFLILWYYVLPSGFSFFRLFVSVCTFSYDSWTVGALSEHLLGEWVLVLQSFPKLLLGPNIFLFPPSFSLSVLFPLCYPASYWLTYNLAEWHDSHFYLLFLS